MSRPFTLPVVIACSAHALLMFGFTKPPSNPTTKPPAEKVETWECHLPPLEEDKPEPPVANSEPSSGGKPSVPIPVSEDRPVEKILPGDMIMEVTKTNPVRVPVDRNIISSNRGPFIGDPNARGDGPGIDTNGIFSAFNLDNAPRTRVQNPPSYPFSLKASGISGEVLVEFIVDESGRVINPRVVRSDHPAFEAPTIAAVSKWRFEPGTRKSVPVRFRMVVPVKFSLND